MCLLGGGEKKFEVVCCVTSDENERKIQKLVPIQIQLVGCGVDE